MCQFCHNILSVNNVRDSLKEGKLLFCKDYLLIITGYKIGLTENAQEKDCCVIVHKHTGQILGICKNFGVAQQHKIFLQSEGRIESEDDILVEQFQIIDSSND